MSSGPLLQLRELDCGYGAQSVVRHLNLHLNRGEIGCLLGPSGCGKTTTLRAIAGFEPVSAGEILLGDTLISRKATRWPPKSAGSGWFSRTTPSSLI